MFVAGVGLTETGSWDWGEPFIVVGIVLWAAVSLVAFGYLAQAMRRAGAQLASEGPSPALGLRLQLVWLSRTLLAVLLVIVFLMTVKPWT